MKTSSPYRGLLPQSRFFFSNWVRLSFLSLVMLFVEGCALTKMSYSTRALPDHYLSSPEAGRFKQVGMMPLVGTCALREEGTLVCWGQGVDEIPQELMQGVYKSFSTGAWGLCGLQVDGKAACWGDSGEANGRGLIRPTGQYTDISVGLTQAWGVTEDGAIAHLAKESVRIRVKKQRIRDVEAGFSGPCFLTERGEAFCVGPEVPGVFSPPDDLFSQLMVGQHYVCGLRTDATVRCWGHGDSEEDQAARRDKLSDLIIENYESLFGPSEGPKPLDTSMITRTIESLPMSPIGQVGGVSNGSLEGAAEALNMLAAEKVKRDLMVLKKPTPPEVPIRQLSRSLRIAGMVCGIAMDGHLLCWGNPCTVWSRPPEAGMCAVPEGEYVDFMEGGNCNCGIRTDGRILCWGRDMWKACSPP